MELQKKSRVGKQSEIRFFNYFDYRPITRLVKLMIIGSVEANFGTFVIIPPPTYTDSGDFRKRRSLKAQKKGPTFYSKPFIYLAPPDGLEPPT